MNNTQLPAEVVEEMKDKAETYSGTQVWVNKNSSPEHLFHEFISATSFEAGATEYATKLHQVEQEKELASDAAKLMTNKNNECQAKLWEAYREIEDARSLLEKVKDRHEAGLLPDRFIYDEIKNFLDGTRQNNND